MNKGRIFQVLLLFSLFSAYEIRAQEYDISGFELSIDQDNFADFLRDTVNVDDNYTISLRLGMYGALANHPYLGLPFVRQLADDFLVDKLLFGTGFREERRSHSFVLTINGFTPTHISDEIPEFQEALDNGYSLSGDRPFSSFTGFRSTRRLEGNKLFVHSARRLDMAINTSFTFGFASLGLARGLDDLFGRNRPDGNLWAHDENKPYPTGQVYTAPMPIFMYSVSMEAVVWRPIKKVIFQIRPEINLGYYTNLGLGIDIGKAMNVENTLDNLSYTDTNNPGVLVVSNEYLSFSIVAGATARFVIYNGHLSGWFGWGDDYNIPLKDTKKLLLEAYAGAKLQMGKKIEFNFSVNTRKTEFKGLVDKGSLWGTFGIKVLLAEEGEGCYD